VLIVPLDGSSRLTRSALDILTIGHFSHPVAVTLCDVLQNQFEEHGDGVKLTGFLCADIFTKVSCFRIESCLGAF
jgi:hypothetical protein